MGIELNNDQIFANYKLEHWYKSGNTQLFEVAGGAGTGKTTMILYFIERIGIPLDHVLFVSYMGKAVSRMIQSGLPARTIHSTCYTYEKEVARDENGKMILYENGKPKMVWVQHLKDHISSKIELIVIDEAFTVPEQNAVDVLSFGIPTVALGDSNQLAPPFGKAYFLEHPDVELHQIMRQAEGNPIIYLANQILAHEELREGVYGHSSVIRKKNLTDFQLRNADVIITASNRLRGSINDLFRGSFLGYSDLEIPHYNEKIICRRNDWSKFISNKGEIYLTNGTTGFVDYVDKRSYNGKNIVIDFKPDFGGKKAFHNLKVDLNRLNLPLGTKTDDTWIAPDTNVFEYAYALTAYSAQGSQWDNVTVLQEDNWFRNRDDYYRLLYSAITRAVNSVTVVLNE